MNAYVDVRGPWPVLIDGKVSTTLVGASRSITVEEARKWVKAKEEREKRVKEEGELTPRGGSDE